MSTGTPRGAAALLRLAPVIACLLAASLGLAPAAATQHKPRLIVLSDIGGDPDDMQSWRRLLLYANDIELLGMVATARRVRDPAVADTVLPELIAEIVDDYAEVWPNLRLHDASYPHPDRLRSLIRRGSAQRGPEHLGPGRGTSGSRHIVSATDAAEGPVHVAIWGGAHDLAQALYDVRARRSPAELERFLAKLRVYAIGDQDAKDGGRGTGEWIRENFPGLRYLQAGPPGVSGYSGLYRGMYQNDSPLGRERALPLVRDEVAVLNQEAWVEENIRGGHGPLGANYPLVQQNPRAPRHSHGVKEGDTPSWFHVLPTGLSDPEHPEWGGWGGRFEHAENNHYFDAQDEHWSGLTDEALRRKWTVARWREAFQNDFAARMDRAVGGFSEVNHNPRPVVDGDRSLRVLERMARPGERLVLDARETADPDGDRISYRWWIYREPSSYQGAPRLEGASTARTGLHVPRDAAGETIHLVLEVVDDGAPRLTGYRRVIVRVEEESGGRTPTSASRALSPPGLP